ncbi:MAG: DUF1998 domain-containing protein, partial [Firmicutes bacterium]|nr:DUF1998 domain-containing protein [Bacillota bacterium]
VLSEVLPLRAMTDPGDLGTTVELANTGRPAIFLYDKYPGGVGFAQRLYDLVEEVFTDALDLISACACEDGCPSCVGSPVPPYSQLDPETSPRGRIPDKEAALVILHDLLEKEPYIPKRPKREIPLAGGEWRSEAEGGEEEEAPPFIPLPDKIESRIRRQLKGLQEKTEKMRR